MKIVIFYQYFGTPKGSWSTRVYELVKRWVDAGHHVTVVTSPYYKSDIKAEGFITKKVFEGINLVIIDSADDNKKSKLNRAFRALIFSMMSVYYALTLKADVVIASSGPITIGIPGLVAKWFKHVPLVFEVRDLWPKGAIELGLLTSKPIIKASLWFEKLCYSNASLVVPCSPGMEAGVKDVTPTKETLVIPNASDPILFKEQTGLPEKFPDALKGKSIFLYAGSLGLMDDCFQIVRSLEYLPNKNIALVFAGDGAEREALEAEAAKSGNDNIHFLGLLPKTEIVKWFGIAQASFVTFKDISVLHTSSPNKMFDSFAAGVPIIQSTKGWIKDLVDEHGCGMNVDPDDPKDFAKAMDLIGNNKDIREEMARKASELAATIFNRDILAGKYLQGLQKVVDERGN